MKSIYFLFSLFFLSLMNSITGQNYIEIAEKIALNKVAPTKIWDASRISDCDLDSILFFAFVSPSDSIVGIKRVFHKYGNNSQAIYEYEFIDDSGVIKLSTVDSTVFDMEGRPLINEFWEFDLDSNKLLLKERSEYFPHEGQIFKDYSFFEDMINELNNVEGAFVDYDSVIIYRREFFSGLMKPYEKKVHVYSQSGYIEEIFEYRFAEFDMSWGPSKKYKVIYNTSSKIDRTEEYIWDGIDDYTLRITSNYTYDSKDSLELILAINNQLNQPSQRMEMSYIPTENSIFSQMYSWDSNTNQWTEIISIFTEFDDLSRINVLKLKLDFFGDVFELQNEYVYIDEVHCPHYINQYANEDGSWYFAGRIYFYPFTTTSFYEINQSKWTAYPNPTSEGIWIEAPIGSKVQFTSIFGHVLYSGKINDEREYIRLPQINGQVILTIQDGSSSSSRLIVVSQ